MLAVGRHQQGNADASRDERPETQDDDGVPVIPDMEADAGQAPHVLPCAVDALWGLSSWIARKVALKSRRTIDANRILDFKAR